MSGDCKDQISFRAHEESFWLQAQVIVKQYWHNDKLQNKCLKCCTARNQNHGTLRSFDSWSVYIYWCQFNSAPKTHHSTAALSNSCTNYESTQRKCYYCYCIVFLGAGCSQVDTILQVERREIPALVTTRLSPHTHAWSCLTDKLGKKLLLSRSLGYELQGRAFTELLTKQNFCIYKNQCGLIRTLNLILQTSRQNQQRH